MLAITPTFEQSNQICERFDQIPPEIIFIFSVSEMCRIRKKKLSLCHFTVSLNTKLYAAEKQCTPLYYCGCFGVQKAGDTLVYSNIYQTFERGLEPLM